MSAITRVSSERPEQAVDNPDRSWSILWQRLELWAERRRQRRELLRLPDHVLKDIGISRAEVLNEAEKPFWKP